IDVILQALAGAKKPLIISGPNAASSEVLQAAANLATALKARVPHALLTILARLAHSIPPGMMVTGSPHDSFS
ncbi:hypothetical protein, partial [Salmonella enterica]|uniref:hypothetical protein n=1 Tax=Salmonella enterica TaxID=28901 RepID=UPI00398C7F44